MVEWVQTGNGEKWWRTGGGGGGEGMGMRRRRTVSCFCVTQEKTHYRHLGRLSGESACTGAGSQSAGALPIITLMALPAGWAG